MAGPESRRPNGRRRNAPAPEPYKPMTDFLPLSKDADRLRDVMLQNPTAANIRQAIPTVMAANSTGSEIVFRTAAFPSKQSIEARYQQFLGAFERMATPYVLGSFQDQLTKLQRKGMIMDVPESFYKSLLGSEESAGREFVEPKWNPTARQQIEALQERFKKGTLNGKEQKLKAISQILAARDVLEVRPGVKGGDERLDYRLTPEVFQTAVTKYEAPLRELSEQQIDALSRQAQIGHGGALTEAYGKLPQRERQRKEAPAKELGPTAKFYIESMKQQYRMAQSGSERRRCAAGIIAARELVDAKRGSVFGGDKALEQQISPKKLAERRADVEEYLRNLTEEDQTKILSQANTGHGGAMLESYRKANTYAASVANLRLQCKYGETRLDMSKIMALSKLNSMEPRKSVDEALISKLAGQIRREPGYEAFSQDPKTQKLLREGSFEEINYNFTRQVVEKNRADDPARQAPQPSANRPVQPKGPQKINEEPDGPVMGVGLH